jgi:feS assembly SUF system protein
MKLTDERIEELGGEVIKVLKTIYDPEIPVDIYELGLVYDVQLSDEGEARVLMTLTTPNCPVAESLPNEVQEKVGEIEGIVKASVEITFEPAWTKDMISEEAKFELGML